MSAVVAIEPTPDGDGYWLVDDEGAVSAMGRAGYYGALDGSDVPIVDLRCTPSGEGYWIVDAEGSVYSFGDAGDYGSW
jgi:hypothetical protein